MGREKVKLAWVVNDRSRKNCFKKRAESLLKKMKELTILCDVDGFVVVYAPESNEPAMWPLDRPKVEETLTRFQNIPEFEQRKKMLNQETYLKELTNKMDEKIKKHQKKNSEMEMSENMYQIEKGKSLDAFDTSELTSLVLFFEKRMKEIKRMMDYFQRGALLPPHESGEAYQNISQIGGNALPDGWNKLIQKDYLHRENVKKIENTDDIGLAPYTYFGSSLNVASHFGLPIGNFVGSGFGLPTGPVNQYENGMVWPYGNLGIRSNKSDIGLSEVNYEDIFGGSDMGQPQVNYGGTTSGGNIGLGMLPSYGHLSDNNTNMGDDLEHKLMPHNDYTGWGVTGKSVGFARVEDGQGHLPDQDDVRGNSGSDIGLPYGLFQSNNGGSDVGMAPSLSGGSSGGSDVELLYDVSKIWQNPFSP